MSNPLLFHIKAQDGIKPLVFGTLAQLSNNPLLHRIGFLTKGQFMQKSQVSHALVITQVIGMVLAVWPGEWGWERGFLLVDAGIGLGIWVLWHNRPGNFSIYPEPIDRSRLITSGPYKRIRHPMYTALLLLVCGFALIQGNTINGVGLAVVLFAVLNKIPREEQYLTERYEEYAAYSRTTYRLMPGIY